MGHPPFLLWLLHPRLGGWVGAGDVLEMWWYACSWCHGCNWKNWHSKLEGGL